MESKRLVKMEMNKQQEEAFQLSVITRMKKIHDMYNEICENQTHPAWKVTDDSPNWDDFWDELLKGVIEDRWLREHAWFEGCIFGDGQECPEKAPFVCGGCEDNSEKVEKWWIES